MGVDISTYLARIGMFVNFGVPKSVGQDVFSNKNCFCAKFYNGAAVFFVSLLLICGDVESNPGPTTKRCFACGIYQTSSFS